MPDKDQLSDYLADLEVLTTLGSEALMDNIEALAQDTDTRRQIQEYRERIRHHPRFTIELIQQTFDEMHSLLLRVLRPSLADHIPHQYKVMFAHNLEGLNASARLGRDGVPLILLHQGVVGQLVFIARLLLRCFDPTCNKANRKARIDEFYNLACPHFKGFFYRILGLDDFVAFTKRFTDLVIRSATEPWPFMLGTQLHTWQQYFILCHEVAHHALGHLVTSPTRTVSLQPNSIRVQLLSPDWAQEYEADDLAMQWCISTLNFLDHHHLDDEVLVRSDWTLAAPDILLLLLQFLQLDTPQDRHGSPTHPPVYKRRQKLVDKYYDEIISRPDAAQMAAHCENLVSDAVRFLYPPRISP